MHVSRSDLAGAGARFGHASSMRAVLGLAVIALARISARKLKSELTGSAMTSTDSTTMPLVLTTAASASLAHGPQAAP